MARSFSQNPKAIRARIRDKAEKVENVVGELYKPLEEWDEEELARGKPRSVDGHFRGPKPRWITPLVEAEIQRRFRGYMDGSLRASTLTAFRFLDRVVQNEEVLEAEDGSLRPVVPYSVRVDAAKYLMDRALGKATTRVEADVKMDLTQFLVDLTTEEGEYPFERPGDDIEDAEFEEMPEQGGPE